jgi:hypothetical protein
MRGMDRWALLLRSTLSLLALVALGGCWAGPGLFAGWTASSGPTEAASPSPSVAQVTVSLGIYSGRPDPSWELSEAQAVAVVDAINALPTTTGTPPQGGLGYHGFTVVMHRAGHADETLVAYRATVAPAGTAPRAYRADPGRTVERLLLDTGRSRLTPMEISVVESDLTVAP